MPIGNIFSQLLYAVRFSEPNLLLSSRVHENSKILYDRNPRQMVEKVAPWLTVDSDPYPAVVDGRIQWILDGYTVTDKYPLSQRESLEEMTDDSLQENTGFQTLPTDEINYLRNSVKATVDAYDGTVTLYEWDEEDPILQAWEEVFPDVVQPNEDIPDALIEHLRYPEDLFKAQRFQFQRYHETSASRVVRGLEPLGGPERPAAHHPPAAAVPPLHRHRRRRDVVADVRLRAAAQGEQPRGLHGGQQRRDQLRLRQGLGAAAAQRAVGRSAADRQHVRHQRGRQPGAAALHDRRRRPRARQPADAADRRHLHVRPAGLHPSCR